MREKLVVELVKEVLGPREGPYEVLHSSPLNEYLTGVLAPVAGEGATDIESSAELPAEDTGYYEGETADVDVGVPPLQHPALDPKKRPPHLDFPSPSKLRAPRLHWSALLGRGTYYVAPKRGWWHGGASRAAPCFP